MMISTSSSSSLNTLVEAAASLSLNSPSSPKASIDRSRLTELERWSIISMSKDNRSQRYIARKLGINRNTVRDVLARFDATGSPGSGSRSGRPRTTDDALDTAIAFTAYTDVFTTPNKIRRKLQLDVSSRTIDRRLQEAGLFGRIARRERVFSAAEKRARLAFANGYRHWTKKDWGHVIFSDEKLFYGNGFTGQVWVRRPKGEELNEKYIAHKVAHPVKVNAWGCFCARGQGYIYLFNETMDAKLKRTILRENLVPSARLHYDVDAAESWWLLHDNDKKFKSNLVQAYLHNTGVQVLDFPPYSPDINPMENLWALMAREVELFDCPTLEVLQDKVAEVWKGLSKKFMKKLVASMPRRLEAIIKAEGGHTDY